MRIAICGGTGFVGTYLTRALLDGGHEVVAVSRGRRDRVRRTRQGLTHVRCDIAGDVGPLAKAMQGCDVAVNLAAVFHERGNQTFARVNDQGAANVAAAATQAGVHHVVQISTLDADPDAAHPYTASRWAGEQRARLGSTPATVIRAGIAFGPGDEFFTRLTRTIRLSRIVAPIIGNGAAVFQPIAIEDLVRVLVATIEEPPRLGIIAVGGPELLTFDEIVATIKHAAGLRRFDVHIPPRAALPMAFLMEKVFSSPPLTRGQIHLLERNHVTRRDAVEAHFDFMPRRFTESAAYLQDN